MSKKRNVKVYGQSGYKYQETPMIIMKVTAPDDAAAFALHKHIGLF